MGELTRLCSRDDLAPGEARRFDVAGHRIALVRCDGGFHAVTDRCSHEDYALSEGEVDGESCEIECWKHGSVFDLLTGAALTLPATKPVAVYRIEEVGDDVMVELP